MIVIMANWHALQLFSVFLHCPLPVHTTIGTTNSAFLYIALYDWAVISALRTPVMCNRRVQDAMDMIMVGITFETSLSIFRFFCICL